VSGLSALWEGRWKAELPELPEVNMDLSPLQTLSEVSSLELRYWRRLITNDALWRDGTFHVLSPSAATLRLLADHFGSQEKPAYQRLAGLLRERIERYYE